MWNRTILIFIQNVEEPQCWWQSLFFVLVVQDAIVREVFVHEEMSGVDVLRVCLAPNVFVGVAVETARELQLDLLDGVFFTYSHRDDVSRQGVDDANTTLDACDLTDDVACVAPPELRCFAFFL